MVKQGRVIPLFFASAAELTASLEVISSRLCSWSGIDSSGTSGLFAFTLVADLEAL